MTLVQLVFYVFSAIAIFSGLMVVVVRNPVHSVLFLVLTFFSMAGVWILLRAEFLALILVLVYVGAVMTLFLFVVMMLSINQVSEREGFVKYLPWAALMMLVITGMIVVVVGPEHFGLTQMPAPPPEGANFNNIANLRAVLYTDYAYAFEIAAVILLAGIVAAIGLAHREPRDRKSQTIEKQIAVRPSER